MKNSLPRNIFFSFLSWLLPLISTFVVTPFIVRWLGAEEYGLLTLILGFISYSFSFGIARAIIKYVAEYRAKDDLRSAEKVLSATLFLSLLVGAGGASVIILLANFLVDKVLLIDRSLQAKSTQAFYIAAAAIAVFMLQSVFSSVLQAVGRYDWFSIVTTLLSTLLSVGNLILAFQGGDAVTLLWWNLATMILGIIIFAFAARQALPEARWEIRFNRQAFGQVLRFSAGVIGYQILPNLLLLFERSWITRVFGTEGVAFYVVPMTLAIQTHFFVASLAMSLMPLMSEIGVDKSSRDLLAVYERATKYLGLITVFAVVALAVGSQAFLTLWLGADFAARSSVILIFHLLTFGSMAFGIVAWQIAEGLGFPARNAGLVLLWLVLSAPLMILLAPRFGLEGVAAARAIGVVLTVPAFVILIERLTFGKIQWRFWQQTILPLTLAGACCGVLLYWGLNRWSISWVSFLLVQAAAGLSYLGVLFLTGYFTPEEQRWLRQFCARTLTAN